MSATPIANPSKDYDDIKKNNYDDNNNNNNSESEKNSKAGETEDVTVAKPAAPTKLLVDADTLTECIPLARDFIKFVDDSPTPFHAVANVTAALHTAGFTSLPSGEKWPALNPGDKVYFTRGGSSIIALTVGGKYVPGNGLKIIGAHTDSPNFQMKPRTASSKAGYEGVGVQCYGGGLWHTWFDRDLTVAGRVYYRRPNDDVTKEQLVKIDKKLLVLPSLAIHLRSTQEREAFAPNKESHLIPQIATQIAAEVFANGPTPAEREVVRLREEEQQKREAAAAATAEEEGNRKEAEGEIEKRKQREEQQKQAAAAAAAAAATTKDEWQPATKTEPIKNHCSVLYRALANELRCNANDIRDFDLSIVDTQPSSLAGFFDEFVCAPRIDNLLSCFCATRAFVNTSDSDRLAEDDMITVIAYFDHEEVGSSSSHGAGGSMVTDLIDFIADNNAGHRTSMIANSFLLSVDGAHGWHPNYPDKHESNHRPMLHEGAVVKTNANQRYATNGETKSLFRDVIEAALLAPLQEFCVKNESPCGSTIGPILSTLSGIKAIDIGAPMLAMHSIREMCSTLDVTSLTAVLQGFIKEYNGVFRRREEEKRRQEQKDRERQFGYRL